MLASRADANQPDIMAALRKVGASVRALHTLGSGVPDLLVGYRGRNYLFEVKDGAKLPSERELTDDQKRWHREWMGQVAVVETPAQAVEMLLRLARMVPQQIAQNAL